MAASVPEIGVKPLQNAMKMAKIAIQLDAGNRHQDAYCEYLRSINYISHVLLEDATAPKKESEVVGVEVEKMLRLAEQCLERAKSFIGRTEEPSPDLSSSMSPSSLPVQPSTIHPTTGIHNNVAPCDPVDGAEVRTPSPSTPGHRRVLSEGSSSGGGGEEPSPFLPPEVFQRLQTVESQDASRKELTPIEEASRLNQKLKANYEARLARLTPGQAYQKTSLTLSLQRQMMENLIIAKARQDALQRKMEERRQRLQEEANRRFAASGTVTPEEQEQRILYANVLEYEQDHDWPKLWKSNMAKNPDDATLVSGLVSYLISCSDHPVMKLLRRQQYRVYNRLYPLVSGGPTSYPAPSLKPSFSSHGLVPPDVPEEAEGQELHTPVALDRDNSFEDLEQFLTQLDWAPSNDTGSNADPAHEPSSSLSSSQQQPGPEESRIQELESRALKEHLKDIVKDIHIAIDQLLSLCLLSFECLNTASSKDLCQASIEEAFFRPLWKPLLALFRKVHRKREQAFEHSMRLYCDASPVDVGVPLKLFPQDPSTLKGSYPYESPVQELKLLCKDCSPQRKLDCIVRTLRLICACAEDYRGLHEVDSAPKTAAIGADDLLPILSFVALRCECPQLVSECAAIEEFIHEGYLIGEEGYCLTSMQSALAYVESLHTGGAQPSAAKIAG